MIISGIVAVNAEKILTSGFAVLGIVMLHNLAGMGLGLGASRLFRVEYTKATAIAIEVGCRTAVLRSHLPLPILQPIHLQRSWEQSSAYGIIFPDLFSQVYVVTDITRKTPRKLGAS